MLRKTAEKGNEDQALFKVEVPYRCEVKVGSEKVRSFEALERKLGWH